MNISVINIESFEGPAYIEEWAEENGHELYNHKLFNGDSLPTTKEFDTLIIMGGTASVNETDKYPILEKIKDLVLDCIRDEKYVFGICLGAQLIASSLGAKVKRMPNKEIGFYNIEINNSDKYFEMFPSELVVAHWHGEMFDIPKGGHSIASSIACPNQIFRVGEKVFGFQCHLEFNDESIIRMIQNSGEELEIEKYVQSAEEIINYGKQNCFPMNEVLGKFMNNAFKISIID